jgi:hypothetical protein
MLNKPRKKRGRPANPYTLRESLWKPGATRDWFEEVADLAPPITPASIHKPDLRWWVYGLIISLEIPVLRRVVEAILVFEHGFEPEAVTIALDRLVSEPYLEGQHIVLTRLPIGSADNHVYSFEREPTQIELDYLAARCGERDRVLTKEALRDAGEQYFRAVLLASGNYTGVTQKKRLGKVTDMDEQLTLDILATDKRSGTKYGISVKNQHEWLYPNSRAIKDCYSRANANERLPWLVVPFATKEAIDRCARDKIRLHVLHRQIVPAIVPAEDKAEDKKDRRFRTIIEDLRVVIGPQPFGYLRVRSDRTLGQSPAALEDVKSV